jgi:hypothetical protein
VILKSEGNKDFQYDKLISVDILTRLDEGELVIVEVQNEREHGYSHRINFSQFKLVTPRNREGRSYAWKTTKPRVHLP